MRVPLEERNARVLELDSSWLCWRRSMLSFVIFLG